MTRVTVAESGVRGGGVRGGPSASGRVGYAGRSVWRDERSRTTARGYREGVTDVDLLLAEYDAQLREAGELARADSVVRHPPVWWARFGEDGFVTYVDLGGLEGEALDALIAETVAHFRDDTDVREFEWKTRGHDAPADLGVRLEAHGLAPDELETVMIGEVGLLAVDVPLPPGVILRRAGDGGDLLDDVDRALAMQEEVFQRGAGPETETMVTQIRENPGEVELWLAEYAGLVVCAGRLDVVAGTGFAGLWGGATLPHWRGRGLYRALTAARARSAQARRVRYLHSDCSPMSRPILERSGLVAVTTTTPYVWTRA